MKVSEFFSFNGGYMWGFLLKMSPRLLPFARVFGGVAVSGGVGFVLGWAITDNHYQNKEKERELVVAKALAKQQEEYNAKLTQAYNELNSAKRDADNLRLSLERVRSAYRAKQAIASPSGTNGGRLEECERLLFEGAGLVGEGGELLYDQHGKVKALKGLMPSD